MHCNELAMVGDYSAASSAPANRRSRVGRGGYVRWRSKTDASTNCMEGWEMTTEIDLLPLPEGEASSFGNYEVHDNEAMIEYARANVARNTALLRAEIEALRAEVERLRADRDSWEQQASEWFWRR